eukprot:Pgem_evm1s12532
MVAPLMSGSNIYNVDSEPNIYNAKNDSEKTIEPKPMQTAEIHNLNSMHDITQSVTQGCSGQLYTSSHFPTNANQSSGASGYINVTRKPVGDFTTASNVQTRPDEKWEIEFQK